MHAPGRLVSSLPYTRFTTRTEWTGTASELLGTLGEMAGERVANPKTYGGSIEFQTLRRNVMARIVKRDGLTVERRDPEWPFRLCASSSAPARPGR
jgi:hypothetical protein